MPYTAAVAVEEESKQKISKLWYKKCKESVPRHGTLTIVQRYDRRKDQSYSGTTSAC